jgi:Uncharacterised nucleotidyltransferase
MLTTIQTLLLDCLKSSSDPVTPDRLQPLTSENWETFVTLAADQRVRPLLYHRMIQRELVPMLPESVSQNLKRAYKITTTRNLIYLGELCKITKAFQEGGIPVIVLKGMHIACEVYGNISLREMDDIDFLVSEDKLSHSVRILEDQSYQPKTPFSPLVDSTIYKHLTPFIKPGVGSVELHWTLAKPDQQFSVDTKGLWERAIPAGIPGIDVLGLSPEDLLLHLCLHTSYQHQFTFGLRPSCDITQVISLYGKSLDWGLLIKRAKQWDWQRGVYLALRVARRLIEAEIPDEPLERLKPASFDETLLPTAISQIFTDKSFAHSLAPHLARIMGDTTWWAKLRGFQRRLFISKTSLAKSYSLSPSSPKIYWFYLVRLKDLLHNHLGNALRLLNKDTQLTQLAGRTLTLMDWLSDKD